MHLGQITLVSPVFTFVVQIGSAQVFPPTDGGLTIESHVLQPTPFHLPFIPSPSALRFSRLTINGSSLALRAPSNHLSRRTAFSATASRSADAFDYALCAPCWHGSQTWRAGKPKPDTPVAEGRKVPDAVRRAAVPGGVVPPAAAEHPIRTTRIINPGASI